MIVIKYYSKINFFTYYIYNKMKLPNFNKPFLFIIAGPTGSGKSNLVKKISSYMELNYSDNEIENFVHIVIDKLVENSKGYKNKIKNIIENSCRNEYNVSLDNCHILIDNINKLDQSLLQKFDAAYYTSRKNLDCNSGIDLINYHDGENCDTVNDNNFDEGLKNKKNIIFETTGETIPAWIFAFYKDKLQDYNIVMAWSFADINILINRNKRRAFHDIKNFINSNYTTSAPRLPDVREKIYIEKVKNIVINFEKIVNKCSNIIDQSKEPTEITQPDMPCYVRYLVFDNTTINDGKNTIIYDSAIQDKNYDSSVVNNLLNIKSRAFSKKSAFSKSRAFSKRRALIKKRDYSKRRGGSKKRDYSKRRTYSKRRQSRKTKKNKEKQRKK